MAEVSDFHRQQTLISQSATGNATFAEEPPPDLCAFDFESLSPPSPSFLRASTTFLRQSDYRSNGFELYQSDTNSIFQDHEDDDADQMNFITDLFRSRCVQLGVPEDRDSVYVEVGSARMDEEFDKEIGVDSEIDQGPAPCNDGLRVVHMESESESESESVEIVSGVDSGIIPDEFHQNCDLGIPGFWDGVEFQVNRARTSFNDETEWEEVNERENISSVIERIEEISVSSDGDNLFVSNGHESEEENTQDLEWQVLLAVNDFEISSEFDGNEMLRDLVDGESSIKSGPPASEHIVENLPYIVLSAECLRANVVVCAVCKDEISAGEEVTRLPCSHHYHMPCIIPWLKIRNTCPVCRYEFPTDDADYEERKNGGGSGWIQDLHVRYNYQLLS